MTSHPRPESVAEQISCEVCHKEIPLSEAMRFETEDYVAHFCGLDCFSTWKDRSAGFDQKQQEKKR
jgi:hypothetical protein